jgi:hypothetical protein
MTDTLDTNGLVVKTSTEIQTELENAYKAIYGDDIVLDSNSADGQLIGILTQFNTDIREMITEVYNTFNPDAVRGTVQDVRYKLNGIERQGGTFTIVDIDVINDRTLTLTGLDGSYNDVNATAFGVQDNAGNQYYLIDTVTITAGTHSLPFRSATQGANIPTVGTLTSMVTVVQGVTSLNNASAPTTIGINQETDEAFALRREKSYEYRSQNSNDAMLAQISALDGVSQAFVYGHDYTNYPSGDDADGIPLHYIWVIVEGGANTDIGSVIYANIGGAGTVGAVDVDVPTSSGQIYTARFDRVESTDLYIKFQIQPTVSGFIFDTNSIKTYISENLTYLSYEYAETSKVTAMCLEAINSSGGGGVPVNVEISLNGSTWVDYLTVATKKNKFVVSTTNITISEVST